MSFSSVVTLCDGTTPLASAAAVISHLARATSGCSNWPGLFIALPGMAPWWPETKSIRPKSSDSTPGRAAISQTSRKAPWVSISTCTGILRSTPQLALDFTQGLDLHLHITGAARLGQGDERQALAGDADQDFHVLLPVGMGDVMDTGADTVEQVVFAHDHAAAISACSRSAPAWAPSSQSQVMSKIGPSSFCSCRALRISFSEPA
jgi:hypothetical protein